ncbi:MAG: choice-of-anchor H family protein [Woeseiaceae bacterium]
MDNLISNTWLRFGLMLALVSLAAAGQASDATGDATRKTITSQGLVSAGGATADTEPTTDERESLALSGQRDRPKRSAGQQKLSTNRAVEPNTDFWIYSADAELFLDRDGDGFYTGIDLLFDADTYYDVAEVYAVMYLSYEYGPWNEYAETETFTIFGAAAGDEYVVETDLVEGYPTGNYDILIELYDAYDDAFVASFGPEDTSELAILPLEDIDRDTPPGTTTQVVVNSGGGGSTGWFLILGLLATSLFRRCSAGQGPAITGGLRLARAHRRLSDSKRTKQTGH